MVRITNSDLVKGTLQALYEYQSAICALTDMDVSNASLYDGGTALHEAAMMAIRLTGRNKIVMDGGVSPISKKIIRTYTSNLNYAFEETPVEHGHSSREEIEALLDKDTAAVILQNPNFSKYHHCQGLLEHRLFSFLL